MKAISAIEEKARLEPISVRDPLFTKSIHPEGGLFTEQRLCCANHSDEEIALDQIGWNGFNCPKCGRDYSIGRKIVTLE
ncbi:MAG: hypothetical protein E6K87_04250 [Thaumarchaeota archaeon]|nr:MAG: hypothetical protein E6K87_04250 [Nitrososphaerota archaeon]TLY07085.1 MAG: hypothetical protein E6K83_06890 [Nitrososphaerota archaeon]